MQPNIARNLQIKFRRANAHDAVCVEKYEDKFGNPCAVYEKISHPIAIFPRQKPAELPLDPELTKHFRGTQKQYEQRGMVLNAPMRMNGRRTIMHRSRMRKQQAEGALRKMGIHHPTPMQVEMYYAGATYTEITRRTLVVNLH